MTPVTTVQDLAPAVLRRRCAEGLNLRIGPFVVRLQGRAPLLADCLQRYYADYPLALDQGFADAALRVRAAAPRWWPPGERWILTLEDGAAFTCFPAGALLAHLEWTINWCIANRAHHYLMLHAAVVERGGLALLLPGVPGAGKSTLCAWLIHHGWRLLSDEFTLLRPHDLRLDPLPRPIPLKSESIAVIAAGIPQARFGPTITGTRKGTVAHLLPPPAQLQRMTEAARPRWLVFPEFAAEATPDLSRLCPAECFAALTQHAFNYALLGETAFDAVGALTESVDGWRLRYARLPDAMRLLDEVCGLHAAS